MKLWNAFGSEHSMNLVLIGRFTEVRDAELAKKLIDELMKQVNAEPDVHPVDPRPQDRRFSDGMRQLLESAKLYNLGPSDIDQFQYDAHVALKGTEVVVTTDEAEVSGFIKVLVDRGARVEIYSAHHHKDTGYGR
jgi:hypothetical protein